MKPDKRIQLLIPSELLNNKFRMILFFFFSYQKLKSEQRYIVIIICPLKSQRMNQFLFFFFNSASLGNPIRQDWKKEGMKNMQAIVL